MGRYSIWPSGNIKKPLRFWPIPPASARQNNGRSVEPAIFTDPSYRLFSSSSIKLPASVNVADSYVNRRFRTQQRLKRALDLAIAPVLLILLLPILAILGLLVRLSGPGPVIFRQTRLGAFREEFVLLKFRTMAQSSEFAQVIIDDPRVTTIGRMLRRLSFDELLQLVNVIRGEMSLVGPRPHAAETTVDGKLFEDAVHSYSRRYAAKPGMTGLAQIRGQRGPTRTIQQLEDRVASDIEYIENWSIWLDLYILIKTIPATVKQANAL